MELESLIHRLEARLFGSHLQGLSEDPPSPVLDERDCLAFEVRNCRQKLAAARADRDERTRAITEMEPTVVLLPSQIEDSFRRGKHSQAMRQALELENLRHRLDQARRDLLRIEQACWSLSFRLRHLARQFERMHGDRASC